LLVKAGKRVVISLSLWEKELKKKIWRKYYE